MDYQTYLSLVMRAGNFEAAMEVFREMRAEKCSPNVKTFTSLISACGRGGHIEEVRTILKIMKESGIEPNAMTYNALIDMYFKWGKQNLAQDAFVEMVQRGLQPTSASFTILMSNFKTAGSYKEVGMTAQLSSFLFIYPLFYLICSWYVIFRNHEQRCHVYSSLNCFMNSGCDSFGP